MCWGILILQISDLFLISLCIQGAVNIYIMHHTPLSWSAVITLLASAPSFVLLDIGLQ